MHLTVEIDTLSKFVDTPCLNYCRKLLREGYSLDTSISFTRGGCVHLVVHSIGDAAKLTVKNNTRDGTPRFVRFKEFKNEKTRNNVS